MHEWMDVCVGKSGHRRCSHTLSIACTTGEGRFCARVYVRQGPDGLDATDGRMRAQLEFRSKSVHDEQQRQRWKVNKDATRCDRALRLRQDGLRRDSDQAHKKKSINNIDRLTIDQTQ